MLRGDIVKDDSEAYAVFTEQGSSASQMTTAKVMDVIAKLPDCVGQAADAVSAYTQVKMEDAPRLFRIPKSKCPAVWIRLPPHKWPKTWANIEDSAVPPERNLYGHATCWSLVVKTVRGSLNGTLDWKKCRIGNGCLFIENKGYSYHDIYMAGKEAEYGIHVEEIDEKR